MPTYELPLRPTIDLFLPYTTRAVIGSTRYISEGTHLDTQIKIWRHHPTLLIVNLTVGSGVVKQTITGLGLVAGAMYRARMRYKNETGWGGWSKNKYALVPSDKTYAALSVPSEPIQGSAVPFAPSFTVSIERRRALFDWQTQTEHVGRRPQFSAERQAVSMLWEKLIDADADTLMAFLLAAIETNATIKTTDTILGTRYWMPRSGTISKSLAGPSASDVVWDIAIDCDEATGALPFTVNESTLAQDAISS